MYDINTGNLAKSLIPFVSWSPDTQINDITKTTPILPYMKLVSSVKIESFSSSYLFTIYLSICKLKLINRKLKTNDKLNIPIIVLEICSPLSD